MKTTDMLEKWLEKCQLAWQAQDVYDRDPSPTNYSALEKARYERGLMEEEIDPRASHAHRP